MNTLTNPATPQGMNKVRASARPVDMSFTNYVLHESILRTIRKRGTRSLAFEGHPWQFCISFDDNNGKSVELTLDEEGYNFLKKNMQQYESYVAEFERGKNANRLRE